ncbi:RNA polymerase sigma-70 factor (sigma-E family) [Humibacillus xanthopallidus]|uniref:RNA polymerase sigma-70 factor (Sigma-E family) n=1 Tax=Humibacillus xanthopallidus TaxID=412689 RepID=A0A543PRD8_9MICO|nr:SigE family RNA polymerase sigma factor [Humibacillus xanthopallidus]TQN46638.1 RNA polymerase sigma-70 factor (sigma-E family) [Humibacillus xanthopallidus]
MEASFEDFVRTRGPALLRYAHLVCGDGHQAHDLVQDALVKVHRRWSVVEVAAPFAYTRRAITNEYLSWRRRLRSRELPAASLPDAGRRVTPAPDDELADRELVWGVVRGLPRRQRVVLVLRYYEDLSDRDIAEVLGVAESTVRSQAARALATLRDHPGLRDDTGSALAAPAPRPLPRRSPR